MVNGVHREVPRLKAQGSSGVWSITSRETPFIMILLSLFHTMSFFCQPGLVYGIYFSYGAPREYHGE